MFNTFIRFITVLTASAAVVGLSAQVGLHTQQYGPAAGAAACMLLAALPFIVSLASCAADAAAKRLLS